MQALQLIYDGVVIGSLYALVGLGLVIIFRTTNVLNFAQGAIATSSAYAAWLVMDRGSLPYVVGLIVAMIVGALVGLAVGAVTTFLTAKASHLEKAIVGLGFFLLIGWGNRTVFGNLERLIPKVFSARLALGDFIVGGHGVYVIVVSALGILATFYLLNRTRLGLAMRALSQDEETARTYGVSLGQVSLASWGIASALGAASGVLVASFIQVDHTIMTTIMLQSFSALVLGGFGSPIGAVVGGVALGISSSLVAGFLAPAYKNTMVFTLLILTLVFRPNGLLGKRAIVVAESGSQSSLPPLPVPGSWRRPATIIGTAAVVAGVLVLPYVSHPFPLVAYSVVLSTTITVIALGIFMGFVGEISLGHGALAAVGAYTTAMLMAQYPALPFPVVIAAAGAMAALIGAVLGWMTLRLAGMYLAIATLALTFVVTEVALQWRGATGGATGIAVSPPMVIGGPVVSDLGIYFLAAATLGVVAAAMAILMRSAVGQRWVAVRDAPKAAAANGVSVNQQKILAFTVSSAVAGIGGGMTAFVLTHIGPFDYGLFFSIFLILAVIVGGAGSLLGAFIGSALISLVPVALNRSAGLTDAVFGTILILLMVLLPGGVRGLRSLLWGRRRSSATLDRGTVQQESSDAGIADPEEIGNRIVDAKR